MTNKEQKRLFLYCDGASRGNPGPGSYGFVVYQNEEILHQGYARLGMVTNNVAEYRGLIEGLKKCRELGGTSVAVRSDSELLVRQLTGKYKVRSPLIRPLFEIAMDLARAFSAVTFEHVPREANSLADLLANKALDGR